MTLSGTRVLKKISFFSPLLFHTYGNDRTKGVKDSESTKKRIEGLIKNERETVIFKQIKGLEGTPLIGIFSVQHSSKVVEGVFQLGKDD